MWHSCQLPSRAELATWQVRSICQPGGGPVQPERKQLLDLGDGTFIVQEQRGCFRARHRRCRTKCLSPDTLIATPSGPRPIRDIRSGTLVWTQSSAGVRVAARVTETSATPVRGPHDVAVLRLQDGRQLVSSLRHPLLGGRVVAALSVGDSYDGSRVQRIDVRAYQQAHTYDILPAGDTGVYWANDIPVASTLRR